MNAFFPGSFDPFTLGHRDVVERAAKIFDKVIVGVAAVNGKNSRATPAKRREIAEISVGDIPNVSVVTFDGLATDAAWNNDCSVILRGIRSAADADAEQRLAAVYGALSMAEVVLLFSSPKYFHVSSTAVRQLASANADLGDFVCRDAIKTIQKIYK